MLEVPQHDDALSRGLERYLMAAVATQQRDTIVTSSAVAATLECSKPTSSEMLRRLERAGHLTRDDSRHAGWQLTAAGRREVAVLRRRQNVVERYLHEVLGLEAGDAARDAARLGPSVSATVEGRFRDALWPASRPCRR